jgi:hypothetical protein
MADNTDIVCMDSTHKVVKNLHPAKDGTQVYQSAFLFTLLVKDRFSKKGIPISFMICSNESQYGLLSGYFDVFTCVIIRDIILNAILTE